MEERLDGSEAVPWDDGEQKTRYVFPVEIPAPKNSKGRRGSHVDTKLFFVDISGSKEAMKHFFERLE